MKVFSIFAALAAACVLAAVGTPMILAAEDDTDKPEAVAETPDTLRLFSFDETGPLERWRVVDDSTMGGASSGTIDRGARGMVVFEGTLSPKGGDGFVSVRVDVSDRDLATYDGLILRVRGDGREYTVLAKTNRKDDGYYFSAPLKVVKGETVDVKIPFSEFDAYFRGAKLYVWDNLDADEIQSIGLMIADEVAGPFRLEVDAIDVYRE